MTLQDLIENYKRGDETCLIKIIDKFSRLINSYSYVDGKIDEDLRSELLINFIKCINKFKFNQDYFIDIYKANEN